MCREPVTSPPGRALLRRARPSRGSLPATPRLLSLGERFGLDAIRGARALSVVALCVTVALSYVLLRRHVYSQKVVVAGTIAVALSSVLLTIYREAMSEHVFIIVVLLFVIAGEEHVRSPGAALAAGGTGCAQLECVLSPIRGNRLRRDRRRAGSRGVLAAGREASRWLGVRRSWRRVSAYRRFG